MMLAGTAVGAGAEEHVSEGCQALQNPAFDGEYFGQDLGYGDANPLGFDEGDEVRITAERLTDTDSDAERVALLVKGPNFLRERLPTELPAEITYAIPGDGDYGLFWGVEGEITDVMWSVDCVPGEGDTDAGDADGDGIADADDNCGDSVLPEGTGDLPNRYRVDADGVFVDVNAESSGVTIADTGGCTAAQIIEAMELGKGHVKFGITAGELDNWIASLG